MNSVIYKFHVRDLLDVDEDYIWNLNRGKMELTFDDNDVVIANVCDVQISWYYWALAEAYRDLKITRKLFLDGKTFTDDLHRKMMFEAISPTIGDESFDKEDVWLLSYRDIYNRIYNAVVTRLVEYIGSTTSLDALELMCDDEIAAANNAVTDDLGTIDHAYETISSVVRRKYQRNPIVRAIVNKTVKEPQILQSIGPRGRITDIDSVIFRKPIKRGFAMGFRDIIAFAKESRSAAKALLFNKDPVAIAEYFNRKLQLVCNTITILHKGDCGTKTYQQITVPDGKEGDQMLGGLAGLFMLDNGHLTEITEEMKHLRGKTISIRTTLCCKHLRNQGVCETCYGMAAYGIPYDSNPGHVSCTSLCKEISQLIISTKHLDFIIHKFLVLLRGNDATYLKVIPGQNEFLYLSDRVKPDHVVLRVLAEEAKNLVQVKYITDVNNVEVTNLSALSTAEFYVRDATSGLIDGVSLDMVRSSTKASLSIDLLKHLQVTGWETINNWVYINLANWEHDKPLFIYPLKHESMAEFGKRVEVFVRSTTKSDGDDDELADVHASSNAAKLTSYNDADRALYDGYRLISSKIKGIHIGHIATILAASRVTSPNQGDWFIPNDLNIGEFRSHDEIIRHRSLSVQMLYGWQQQTYNDLSCYLQHKRPYNPMDGLIYIAQQN